MATLKSLQVKIAKLQAQAEAIVKQDSTAVIAKIRDIMDKHGLTTADIEAHVGGANKRGRKPGVKAAAKSSASAAKYRDPKTGATWTGHGRAPAWIAGAKDRSRYLVEGDGPTPIGKPKVKAGNYVRGVQPALYADPKTGATWSGRGRAPAWLANVKDRAKFLIAEAGKKGPAASQKKSAATKKPATKTAATKNVATKKAPAKKSMAEKIATGRAARKTGTKKVATKSAEHVQEAPAAVEAANVIG